jgi:hypothetical protein
MFSLSEDDVAQAGNYATGFVRLAGNQPPIRAWKKAPKSLVGHYCKEHIDQLRKKYDGISALEKLEDGGYVEYPRRTAGFGELPTLTDLTNSLRRQHLTLPAEIKPAELVCRDVVVIRTPRDAISVYVNRYDHATNTLSGIRLGEKTSDGVKLTDFDKAAAVLEGFKLTADAAITLLKARA